MQEAASQLGIGLSVLKRVCRAIGLARWPFRKRQSLRNVMEQTKLYLNVRPAPRPSWGFPSQSQPPAQGPPAGAHHHNTAHLNLPISCCSDHV